MGPTSGSAGQRPRKPLLQDAGLSRGSARCLRSCSAARGHPSWLLALFAALIQHQKLKLFWSYMRRNSPRRQWPRRCFCKWAQQEQTRCCSPRPRVGFSLGADPACPLVPPNCPTPFVRLQSSGFARGCLSPCLCRCHSTRGDHIFLPSL